MPNNPTTYESRLQTDHLMNSNGNNNNLGIALGAAFGSSNIVERQGYHGQHQTNPYIQNNERGNYPIAGERHASAAISSSAPGRAEGLLNQSGVSHSALVNSGNAAILGHSNNLNSLKLNSNNNNMVGGSAAAAMGSTYGAISTANERLHGERDRMLAHG